VYPPSTQGTYYSFPSSQTVYPNAQQNSATYPSTQGYAPATVCPSAQIVYPNAQQNATYPSTQGYSNMQDAIYPSTQVGLNAETAAYPSTQGTVSYSLQGCSSQGIKRPNEETVPFVQNKLFRNDLQAQEQLTIQQLQENLDKANNDLIQHTKKINKLTSSFNSQVAQIAQLNTKISQKTLDLSELRDVVNCRDCEIEAMADKIDELEETLEANAQHKYDFDELKLVEEFATEQSGEFDIVQVHKKIKGLATSEDCDAWKTDLEHLLREVQKKKVKQASFFFSFRP
jgi:multidrug efflux pump subunit AcrB